MEKVDKIVWILFVIFVFFILGVVSYGVFIGEMNNRTDNKILNQIIYKDLTGNEAVKYCIENYGEVYGAFNYVVGEKCFNLIQTRNTLT